MINAIKPAETPMQTVTPIVRKPMMGIISGPIVAPVRVCLFGPEGIGKSTFAAGAENVIFICQENGTERLNVSRLPQPTHWKDGPLDHNGDKNDVFSMIDRLRTRDHTFKTLAIDTADSIEPLVFKYVCDSDPKSKGFDIVKAYGGYGNGFKVAVSEWIAFLAACESLRKERGMNIIILAHSQIKKFSNPEGEDYDRYQLAMHDKSAEVIKRWCDGVLFAHQQVFASKKETSDKKNFGVSSNVRVMFTQRRPAWDAKNRWGLPDEMPLSWADLMKHVGSTKSDAMVDGLIAAAKEHIGFMPEATQAEAMASLERVGRDSTKLEILLNWIQAQQQAT